MDNQPFYFKNFHLYHNNSALKIGTDSILLASVIPLQQESCILDIGSGCGVILFCLAERKKSQSQKLQFYTGVDIDLESIKESKGNVEIFPKTEFQHFSFIHSTIQDFATENIEYDLIVSNPPFFGDSLQSPNIQKRKSKHRDDNLSFEELVNCVDTLLSPSGIFYLILPVQEMIQFDKLIFSKEFYQCYQMDIQPIKAKATNRIVKGYCRKKPSVIEQNRICIRETPEKYTEEYKERTKLFYINF